MARRPLILLAILALLTACWSGPPAPSASDEADAPSESAAVSPAATEPIPGGLIAYAGGVDPQVHLLDPRTGEERQLTHLGPDDAALGTSGIRLVISCGFGISGIDWAPDGQSLAFDYGACDAVIHVADLDGTLTRIAEGHTARWSPDGSRLAFGQNVPWMAGADGSQPAFDLMLAEMTEGGGLRQLTAGPAGFTAYDPHWSLDGSLVAFSGPADRDHTRTATFVVDAAGGEPREVGRGVFAAGWLADGKLVVGTNETSTFHAMRIEDGEATELGAGGRAVISADGSAIALWHSDPATGQQSARITSADGQEPIAVEGVPMTWSPDGSVLVIGMERADGTATIRLVDAEGAELASFEAVGPLMSFAADWQPATDR